MTHGPIIRSTDLERFAETHPRDCQSHTPEIINALVSISDQNARCRIPYGDAVNQPGWDGLVDSPNGFLSFLPEGKSFWEIGTGNDPQKKATAEFTKRTENFSADEKAESFFIFVTPRGAAAGGWDLNRQEKWLGERQDKGWKGIMIIDSERLADWLGRFPSIARRTALIIGLSLNLDAISTPNEHWELIRNESANKDDPPLPAKLYTEGRAGACEALQKLFEQIDDTPQTLYLFTESYHDVADFVAAFLLSLDEPLARAFADKCLLISERNTWLNLIETRSPHVLVADPKLDLATEEEATLISKARQRGHSLVIPLTQQPSHQTQFIRLQSPSSNQVEAILVEADFPKARAKELAQKCEGQLSALKRYFLNLSGVVSYASDSRARPLSQASLSGSWLGSNSSDQAAIAQLLGKPYGDWIETLRADALLPDSPLTQQNEKWSIKIRSEAWGSLGMRLTDDDLNKFKVVAQSVLGEINPELDLEKDQRYLANIHGKELKHSSQLRKGLAESLALLGCQPEALTACSENMAVDTTFLVVKELLDGASWTTWASLNQLLPLLAEASPSAFLKAVETALTDLQDTPFHRLFEEEGGGPVGGTIYTSGLLWALEGLAWNEKHLPRVAIVLADMASIDPGGTYSNRPANSLTDIFLPWHFQTSAALSKRIDTVETVLREQPEVGWNLLLSLLPRSHGSTGGCHRPTWRNYVPSDWKDGVLIKDYWEQIKAYIDLAVNLAKGDTEKLVRLVGKLADLEDDTHQVLLQHLKSQSIVNLPETERFPIWEKLQSLSRHHRRFLDSDWAFSEEKLLAIEDVCNELEPKDLGLKFSHLFNSSSFDLFDERGEIEEQEKKVDFLRNDAICALYESDGLSLVIEFSRNATFPNAVGNAFATIATPETEEQILPGLLTSPDESIKKFIAGYVWTRFWNERWQWADQLLSRDWTVNDKAAFLILLPSEVDVWQKVDSHLGEEYEELYWKDATINPNRNGCDSKIAIEKLLKFHRPAEAVYCSYNLTKNGKSEGSEFALRALISVTQNPDSLVKLDKYRAVKVISHLQNSQNVNLAALAQIEWFFLPWLDRFSEGEPRTLEKELATDPSFFTQVIGLVFRSKDEQELDEEIDEGKQNLAQSGYRLLNDWKWVPGTTDDGIFEQASFERWFSEVEEQTRQSGRLESAYYQMGQIFTQAPEDPEGLWIHKSIAAVLDRRSSERIRSGFTTELFNQRGVHGFSAGKEETELAQKFHSKAEALDQNGFQRFATAIRDFAERYDRAAETEKKRDPYNDL